MNVIVHFQLHVHANFDISNSDIFSSLELCLYSNSVYQSKLLSRIESWFLGTLNITNSLQYFSCEWNVSFCMTCMYVSYDYVSMRLY